MSKKKRDGVKKFPKQLYVKVAGEDDSQYFEADETSDSAEDGDEVAIYELKEVKTKRVVHTLD